MPPDDASDAVSNRALDAASAAGDYGAKVRAELARYTEQQEVHDLPAIYHYWSERYCLPLFQEVGFDSLNDFFDLQVAEQCERCAPEPARLVSLGGGNGDTEIGIASRLKAKGIENLDIVLLELNSQMLQRAMIDAKRHGIAGRVTGVATDLNEWRADRAADIYFANHSLHHIVELESLFDQVESTLTARGILLVNDMIGRNGHVRWPEAADLVDRVWDVACARYRRNPFQGVPDDTYPDIDCSNVGFEGVRAQDILPLLLARFHPDVFVSFLNIADPFIDRVYGPNFNITKPEDLAFIDALGRLDDAALDLGLVTPTHLVASFRLEPVRCTYPRERSPERMLRPVGEGPYPIDASETITHQGDSAATDGLGVPSTDGADMVGRLDLEYAWAQYHHLRQRRAVRIALRLAEFRHRLTAMLGQR